MRGLLAFYRYNLLKIGCEQVLDKGNAVGFKIFDNLCHCYVPTAGFEEAINLGESRAEALASGYALFGFYIWVEAEAQAVMSGDEHLQAPNSRARFVEFFGELLWV